jgi:hypothetical protein
MDKDIVALAVDYEPVAHPAVKPLHQTAFHGGAALGRSDVGSCAVGLLVLACRTPAHLNRGCQPSQDRIY